MTLWPARAPGYFVFSRQHQIYTILLLQGEARLALQLLFLLEMSTACFGLVGAAPERPCDDACGLDTPLCKL
jgi:hypothetical protein